jgi:hypothetical protein
MFGLPQTWHSTIAQTLLFTGTTGFLTLTVFRLLSSIRLAI